MLEIQTSELDSSDQISYPAHKDDSRPSNDDVKKITKLINTDAYSQLAFHHGQSFFFWPCREAFGIFSSLPRDQQWKRGVLTTGQPGNAPSWIVFTCIFGIFLNFSFKNKNRDFPGSTVVKNTPANSGDTGSSPSPGRPYMLRSN